MRRQQSTVCSHNRIFGLCKTSTVRSSEPRFVAGVNCHTIVGRDASKHCTCSFREDDRRAKLIACRIQLAHRHDGQGQRRHRTEEFLKQRGNGALPSARSASQVENGSPDEKKDQRINANPGARRKPPSHIRLPRSPELPRILSPARQGSCRSLCLRVLTDAPRCKLGCVDTQRVTRTASLAYRGLPCTSERSLQTFDE